MQNENLTPQSNMSAKAFERIMKHQGIWGNRSTEASVYRHFIDGYKSKHNPLPLLLEVGSGLGDMAEHLYEMVASYQGIDTNPHFIQEARKRFPHLSFSEQNFFLLPMECKYDVVCVPYTLINLFNFARQEVFIRKALKHGKLVLINTILPDVHEVYQDTTIPPWERRVCGRV